MTEDAHERGTRIRREVLGDEHVDRAVKGTTDHTAEFQDFITRYAWGEIWARPGLDRRTRSFITLTALVALGRTEELELHVHAALRNGLTQDEIGETILHAALYCGIPAANTAFAVAQLARHGERIEEQQPLPVVDRVGRHVLAPRLGRPPLRVRCLPMPESRPQLAHRRDATRGGFRR